jgi:hypothetical protein
MGRAKKEKKTFRRKGLCARCSSPHVWRKPNGKYCSDKCRLMAYFTRKVKEIEDAR